MKEPLITVGYYKGEMDFGVLASIGELTIDQMDQLRIMTMVAVGQAEQMWARAKDLDNPTCQAEDLTK